MTVNKMTLRIAAACFVGIFGTVIAFAGVHLSRTTPGYVEFQEKLGKREYLAMKPSPIHSSWMISGTPVCNSTVFSREHDYSSPVGIWECRGPAKFSYQYAEDESIYIIAGKVEIEYLDKKFSLAAGDSAHFAAGTTATWTVPEYVRKTFRIHELGRIKRYLRRLVGQSPRVVLAET